MKTLTLIFTLVFTVMFSSTSFAGWTKVSKSVDGSTHYVDFERIRKHGGYVYYWYLSDYLKPIEYGILSNKEYHQGDCKLFRYKWLSLFFHTQPMGGGSGENIPVPEAHKDWKYPTPNSSVETVLKSVCSR